jgi:hypothetical protein
MDRFHLCSGCACYVKREDPVCPFCGASAPPRPSRAALADPARRMSRAQWLAFGAALSVTGCSSGAPTQGATEEVTVTTADGGKTQVAVCASRSGYFPCGGHDYCDRSIQACVDGVCEAYDTLGSCAGCPTCDCLRSACTSCTDDGNGGLTADDSQCNPSSGGCYGAPPARLERLS